MRLSFLLFGLAQAKYIVPGGRWHDTEGNLINAHAGGVTVDKEGKFWWFGEYKPEEQVEGGGVSVYSSDDLATWEHHGLALQPIPEHPFISPEHIIQRPKVVYSEELDKYTVSPTALIPASEADEIDVVARRQLHVRPPPARVGHLGDHWRTIHVR